jgi:hypothetical protein
MVRAGEPRQCRGSMMLFLFSRAEGARSGKAISEAEDGMGREEVKNATSIEVGRLWMEVHFPVDHRFLRNGSRDPLEIA